MVTCPLPTYSRFRAFKRLLVAQNVVKLLTRLYAAPAPSCIRHADVAEKVARQVRDRQQNKDSALIINNPGSVNVVRKFKKLGVKHIACTAMEKENNGNLQRALGKENVFCTSHNVMTVNCAQLEEEIINQLPVSINDTGLTILSTLNQRRKSPMCEKIFNILASTCLAYPGLLDTPKTEFFIFLTHNKWKRIQTSYWLYSYKIYHAFFNVSHVMELDSTDFDPELIEDKVSKTDEDTRVHLVHLTPNQAVLSELSMEDRIKFKKFVRFCSRKETIVTFLEHFVPGSGIHLIKMGFTMSDENMTMTAEQYFNIYKNLCTWPEFEDSSLKLILEDKPIRHDWAMHKSSGEKDTVS